MAPTSRPWTSGSGDGATPYTAAQWASIYRKAFGDGVLRGIGGELAVSGTASPLTVQAGAAFVDGIFFEDPSTTSLTITTPAATTGGHVVLRADWSARTARLVAVLNSSGVTTPPNLTQTSGSLYEIRLATFTITNAGVITLTDARSWARYSSRVSSSMLEDGAVSTAAKIANGIITAAKLAANAVIDALGYTPANKAGEIFTGPMSVQSDSTSNFSQAIWYWIHTGIVSGQRRMAAFLQRSAAGTGAWFLRHFTTDNETSWRDIIVYDLAGQTLDLSATALRFNGSALPALSHRQGGSATNWGMESNAQGTTNYGVSGPVRMQAGHRSIIIPNGQYQTEVVITLPVAFSAAPLVFTAVGQGTDDINITTYYQFGTDNPKQTFRIVATRFDRSSSPGGGLAYVNWLAIGPA